MGARKSLILLGAAMVTLSACDNAREAIGLTKKAPDEFAVITKAPLVLPPDYTLRPPGEGQSRPGAANPRKTAEAALTGAPPTGSARQVRVAEAPSVASTGEGVLLRRANVGEADPNIRAIITEETALLAEKDKSFTDSLIFWQDKQPFGTVVDAAKERQRLQEKAATGESVASGETPTIERRKRGILEGIFD